MTEERFIAHLELIWPQTVSVADKTFLEAIRDLYVQFKQSNIRNRTIELLEKNPDKIIWKRLSNNWSAIDLIEKNPIFHWYFQCITLL